MNYHSDDWILDNLKEHYNYAITSQELYRNGIVGIFYRGSANYGLDTENSDVDSLLLVIPSFSEMVLDNQPISKGIVKENGEHIDIKDLRAEARLFLKSLVSPEILYTKYYITNSTYSSYWEKLVNIRDDIAHYDEMRTVKGIGSMCYNNYKSFYNVGRAKFLYNMLREEEFLERYVSGEPYEKCLISNKPQELIDAKLGKIDDEEAKEKADAAMCHVDEIVKKFDRKKDKAKQAEIKAQLDSILLGIFKRRIFGV